MNTINADRPGAHAKGFTLIEVMITVGIVAILAAIAYPAYQQQVIKTHRGAAKACLSQYAQFMERRYTTTLTYAGDDPLLGCASEGQLDTHYGITVQNKSATTYTVQAAPTPSFAARDTRCGTLTLNQAGTRTAGSGSADDIRYCW